MPWTRDIEPPPRGIIRMGRQSPRGRQSRRAVIMAPLGVAIAAGLAYLARNLPSSAGTAVEGPLPAIAPTRTASVGEITWAPGSRLGASASTLPRALPRDSGEPGAMVRIVVPEPGVERSVWLGQLIAAGVSPDVVTGLLGCEVRRIPVASPVTDLVRRDHLQIDQFDAGAYRALEAGGDLWGLPYAWTGAEIGVALDRSRFPQVGVPNTTHTMVSDVDRQANGWSWAEFAEAMAVAASEGRRSGAIALERFGTIRSLPATWRARWGDDRGRIALADREPIIEALSRFDTLRREIGTLGRRADAAPTPIVRRGMPTAAPIPTPGIMRGPASVALGVGGPGLMRAGRAAATSIETEQAPEFASTLLMPLPRGAASVADVEPILATITRRTDRRDSAWRLMRLLVEDGRLARAERLVPAWRASQAHAVAELVRGVANLDPKQDSIGALFAVSAVTSSLPRDGEARTVTATPTVRRVSAVESLILGAVRRAAPLDSVLDGPAGTEARTAIANGLRAWEAGEMSSSDALDSLGPTLQAILDRTPGVLPA